MKTLRLALVFVVIGLALLLATWAAGLIAVSEASDTAVRTVAIVAIGAAGAAAVLALLGGGRPPTGGDSSGQTRNGPSF